MTKKIISIFIVLAMILTAIPLTISASETDTVYITISDDSSFITDIDGNPMSFYPVTLNELAGVDLEEYGYGEYLFDADGDSDYELTALHLYIYVHEAILGLDWSDVNVSGSAGSIYFAGGLFGFSDENLRYDLNGAYPAVDGWGLTADQIVLKDGDFLNIAHYSSWSFWMDSAAGFRYITDSEGDIEPSYSATVNQGISLRLVRSYSDWTNGGAAAFVAEPYAVVYCGTSYGVPSGELFADENGFINIAFPLTGTWYVWTDGGCGAEYSEDIVSSPALATVCVKENPDSIHANTVEEKINAIGTVTIFNHKKICEAREAYDALTDSQKELVYNYDVLTDAESAFADLLTDASAADHKAIYEATGAYINSLGTPSVGSTGGEWMVIDLTRSGYDCPEGYYENVVNYVNEKINDKEQLHRAKSTDNSRVILALTSAGYDVTDVDGHNLLMGLTDMTYLKKQGINGPIWALIAFDCHGYEIPVNADATEQATREKIIAYILEKQLEDGGWALSGKVADPDMTGMAIQSLAPYYETNAEVKAAIDKAIICLSEKQYDNGGFGSIDGICSESCAQVIVALTALGINPETDPRFVKNGVSVVDAMCLFAVESGGFAHIPDAGINDMATEQAQYALTSYFRFLDGKTSLYDMSDVDIYTKDEKAADAVEAMISAIGTVTAESKDAVEEARAAYDALTDEQKTLVENYDTLTSAETALAKIENDIKAADDVEAMISAIGTVTAESKSAIEEARAAYDALTDEQKALIENYETLTSAETTYSELTAEKELSFFEKLINWIVNAFNWVITLFQNIFSF